jgi:hypothetical protein
MLSFFPCSEPLLDFISVTIIWLSSFAEDRVDVMADAAGLAVGVVALAGIFKDVVDLYSLYVTAKHMDRDYELLDTKLDVEITLLCQWADRVGLLRADPDTRLESPSTRDMGYRVLNSIRLLLTEVSTLKAEYGARTLSLEHSATSPRPAIAAQQHPETRINSLLLARLGRDFDQMRSRLHIHGQAAMRKVRWTIVDKKEFETLLGHLSCFTAKLNELIPVPANAPTGLDASVDFTQGQLRSILGLHRLNLVLEASRGLHADSIADAAQHAIDETCKDRILDKLWFRTISAREEEIKDPVAQTMEWALEAPEGGGARPQWDDLSAWLGSGEGIYWVSRKAGSGKSTLMKLLSNHSRTKALLTEWANGGQCNVVSFFFWNLGTPEQRTQEGLCRSLLYQILSQHRNTIPDALDGMWKELNQTEGDVSLPSLSETRRAFRLIASRSSELGKFCLFIDGLHEFTGDYQEAIAVITELTLNPNIKAVVSSRPIPVCVAAFDDCPKLRLHDLTRWDIRAYVRQCIGGHKYMASLMRRYPDDARDLLEDIVDKSSGVFLWVVFACRSLLSGFADGDEMHELRRRVEELPPELKDMFQHMVGKVDARHREEGANVLWTCYWLHRHGGVERIGSLALALLLRLPVQPIDVRELSTERKSELCQSLAGRLVSRCGGLLELRSSALLDIHRGYGSCGFDGCFCGNSRDDHDPYIDGTVGWIHRSMKEFLDDDSVWELDCLRVGKDRPSIAGMVSLYELYMATRTPRPDDTDVLHFSACLTSGAEADLCEPMDRRNSFWHMQPVLRQLFEAEPADSDSGTLEGIKESIRYHPECQPRHHPHGPDVGR